VKQALLRKCPGEWGVVGDGFHSDNRLIGMNIIRTVSLLVVCAVVAGCARLGAEKTAPARLQGVSFHDPVEAAVYEGPITLRGARNETVSFAVRINEFPKFDAKTRRLYALRVTGLKRQEGEAISGSACSAYQVLPMPVQTQRAGFVRHMGVGAWSQKLPRALLPMPMGNGTMPLGFVRDSSHPTRGPQAGRLNGELNGEAPIIWVDVQIPPTVAAGEYKGECELIEAGETSAWAPIRLTVDDFVIPDERHLLMVGLVDWEGLRRLWPEQFARVPANLLSRREEPYAGAVKVLDELVKVAQRHRATVVIPGLQPIVKWPSGKPPQIDWGEHDAIVSPWLKGDGFADLVPLGYWPLPAPDYLEKHEPASRVEYWRAAAGHFDQMDWLSKASVAVEKKTGGRVRLAETGEISREAGELLAIHPRLRVTVPLSEEQVVLSGAGGPKRIDAGDLDRVMYAAAGLVSAPPMQKLPENAGTRWLRTDLPGLIPYVGAGADEREVRLWAWLAYLRKAQLVQWASVLPRQNEAGQAAEFDELAWFYPGSWFGVEGPVPTLQLKWLRRAEQDYEYLWLARQRGQGERATMLARLITKPVELQPAQTPDAVYALLSGSSEGQVWTEALDLLAKTILLSEPGQSVDRTAERELAYKTTTWSRNQERPLLLGRAAQWIRGEKGDWVELRLGIDIYNAAELQPQQSRLHWTLVPDAWEAQMPPVEVPQLGTYNVSRFVLSNKVELAKVSAASRHPVKVTLTDGFSGRPFTAEMMVPVAYSERREGAPPKIDGDLADWSRDDAIHEGRLVQMVSRPSVQKQELRWAEQPSAVYSTWTGANVYLGFKVEGADAGAALTAVAGTSFISYDMRRAWGEDVCEVLAQAVYADNSTGPLVHLACKPRGQLEIARRLDPKLNASPWQAFAGSDILYAATLVGSVWRGEIAAPWEALADARHAGKRPAMLRFNFAQHRGTTGESSSWAGPVDFGRDEGMMGLVEIREPQK
jgi:hypothetical protein